MAQKNNIAWGLFLLRFGLGLYLAMWSIDKMAAPNISVIDFSHFYMIHVSTSVIMLIGAMELVLSLFFLLGMYKTLTYGLSLMIHMISSFFIYHKLMWPFGEYHFFIANLPIFFSFLTLFLLRDLDSKLTLGKKKTIFT